MELWPNSPGTAGFSDILHSYALRYPLMEPQDYGKLAYQSEYGPEHLFSPEMSDYLREEWDAPSGLLPATAPEPLGHGLGRFHLGVQPFSPEAVPLVTRLMALTAERCRGSEAGMADRLALLEQLPVPGMTEWLALYRRAGCPPVSHSPEYRSAYSPHYRVLGWDYACYFPVLMAVQRLLRGQGPVLVKIDGRCGSGKSYLAAVLQQVFPCRCFHMDDFFLPMDRRTLDWLSVPGGNMDLERFRHEVLEPAQAGKTVCYRRFDNRKGILEPLREVPPTGLTVVEGTYSHHPELAGPCQLKVFLTCSPETQARRLRKREGGHFADFLQRWIPLEERYFSLCRIGGPDALVLDTDPFC